MRDSTSSRGEEASLVTHQPPRRLAAPGPAAQTLSSELREFEQNLLGEFRMYYYYYYYYY